MEDRKPIWKKWWFWALITLFLLTNLWMNQGQQDPSNPALPLKEDRVGTH